MPWLIVGLGNPGSRYERTPHNLGFEVVDALVQRHRLDWQDTRKFQAQVAAGSFDGEKLYFMKPQTFMNVSGNAVQPFAAYYQIETPNILAVCDEVNLPYGRIRLRADGSHGGHNGLRDLVSRLGGQNFARLRVGCQPNHPVSDLAAYVLGPMRGDAWDISRLSIEAAVDCVEMWLSEGPQKAMAKYNGWSPPE